MFLTIFMIKFRSLRENESMIAPCAWVSGEDGGEHGVFLVVTKTQEGTENDYAIAGDRSLLFHKYFSSSFFYLFFYLQNFYSPQIFVVYLFICVI
jgi:hypothetical protein